MTTPVYSAVAPTTGAAGGITNPVITNGNVWFGEYPSGGSILGSAPLGLGSSSTVTPTGWGVALYSSNLVVDGSGNIWASCKGSGLGNMFWGYYNPATLASGSYNMGGYTAASYYHCLGPSGDIWGTGLGTSIYKYVPFAGSQTAYTLSGAAAYNIVSDGTSLYVNDISGANSAIWKVTSGGVGTKYTPAITGHVSEMGFHSDGNLWLKVITSSTLLTFYVINPSTMALVTSYTVTVPSGGDYIISIDTSGTANVWSISTSGTAVANSSGTFSTNGGGLLTLHSDGLLWTGGPASGSDGNLYYTGTNGVTTYAQIVEAKLTSPPMQLVMLV